MGRSARVAVALLLLWALILPVAVQALPFDWARLYAQAPILVVLGLVALAAAVGAVLRLLRC